MDFTMAAKDRAYTVENVSPPVNLLTSKMYV